VHESERVATRDEVFDTLSIDRGLTSTPPASEVDMANQANSERDFFTDADGRPRRLRGVSILTGSTRLAEIAARLGFEIVWIEMEHGTSGFERVEAIVTSVQAGGAAAAVRVPGQERHHILRALEVGADFVIVPMVNTAEQAARVVEFGKFPPVGQRGFNTRSRGVRYGLEPLLSAFAAANRDTHLIAQIETAEAAANARAICAVPGLSGILVGPGDLSASLGVTGEFNHPKVIEMATSAIRDAKAAGLHAGILVAPGKLLDAAIAAGCDFMFYGSDIGDVSAAWRGLLGMVEPTIP
jgi:4-hydroxy-2-oxoheptanedioate aldolase